jgi:hypothetical protein
VHHTLPPRAKPEYIGNPSPSDSDPAAQSTLPCLPACLPATSALHALPCPLCPLLLFSARLVLSLPGHFIRDGGGNQQLAIVPSELNTNIYFLLSQALSNACHSFKVTLSFLSLARPRATASLLHHRCSSPTGACPICATHRPQDPDPSCFRTCAPTLVHRRTTRHEARVPNGVCVYRISPVPITHHLTSASDQGYLDTNLWWKRENQGRRRHTRSRRGDLGTGHQNRETPRRAKSRQGRSELFSPAQPSHNPLGKGGAGPSRLLVVAPGYFQGGKPSVLLIARALLHTSLEAPSPSCTTAPSRLGLSLGQLQKATNHGSRNAPSQDIIRCVDPDFVMPCASLIFYLCSAAAAVHSLPLTSATTVFFGAIGHPLPLN